MVNACRAGDVETITSLLDEGYNANGNVDDYGSTPLQVALYCGHNHAVTTLVEGALFEIILLRIL
jgi:ankyrin repeat protein